MAKDDYHVIVYQILAYLYQRLKKGENTDPAMISVGSPLFAPICDAYWAYILYNLQDMGMVNGIHFVEMDGLSFPYPVNVEMCMITPNGIEYLTENSTMKKAIAFLKEAKSIVPFPI